MLSAQKSDEPLKPKKQLGEIEKALEPITTSIKEAMRISGLGRTFLSELMDLGKIQTVKIGRRRLVVLASLQHYLLEKAIGQSR